MTVISLVGKFPFSSWRILDDGCVIVHNFLQLLPIIILGSFVLAIANAPVPRIALLTRARHVLVHQINEETFCIFSFSLWSTKKGVHLFWCTHVFWSVHNCIASETCFCFLRQDSQFGSFEKFYLYFCWSDIRQICLAPIYLNFRRIILLNSEWICVSISVTI